MHSLRHATDEFISSSRRTSTKYPYETGLRHPRIFYEEYVTAGNSNLISQLPDLTSPPAICNLIFNCRIRRHHRQFTIHPSFAGSDVTEADIRRQTPLILRRTNPTAQPPPRTIGTWYQTTTDISCLQQAYGRQVHYPTVEPIIYAHLRSRPTVHDCSTLRYPVPCRLCYSLPTTN